MKHIRLLFCLCGMLALSACAMSSPFQKAMGESVRYKAHARAAALGGASGALAGAQPTTAFQTFFE